jgi:hypothetical protein
MIAQPLTYRCPHCGKALEVDPSIGDELLICPSEKCGKPFKAEVPIANPSPPLIVPKPDGQLTAAEAPAATSASELPRKEEEIARIPLSMFRRYPFRLLAYLLLTGAGVALLVYGIATDRLVLQLAGVGAVAFTLYRLLAWWLRVKSTSVTLTNQRCLLQMGLFRKRAAEVQLEHVTDVQVRQSLFGRILNVGDVVLVSDEGEMKQVLLLGVPDPRSFAEKIQRTP